MPIRTSLPHSSHASTTQLVGRAHEQDILRRCLAEAREGRGRIVLVAGESGIGKTTLVRTLVREAATEHAIVLSGSCYDFSATSPYAAWLGLLGSYQPVGDLPGPPSSIVVDSGIGHLASQEAFFADIYAFVSAIASRQQLVMVLEDLHWADPASLDLLRYLGRQLDGLRLLVVGTYRPQDLTRRHPLYQLLPALVREADTERLNLRRLGDDEIRQLVANRYLLSEVDEIRLVACVRDYAEGNPFFTEEVLRTLEEDNILSVTDTGWRLGDTSHLRVPPLLKQVIDSRLDRLGEETRDLLAIAAVLGQEIPYDLWRTVSGAGDDILSQVAERALEAHLLEESSNGEGFAFTHALIREALYEGLLLPQRRAWHRRAAEALTSRSSIDIDAVAYHFHQARHDQAAEWLMRSGERAQQLYAWRTAAERFEAVVPFLDGKHARERGWLQYRTGMLLRYSDPARGISHLEDAEQVARDVHDPYLAACAVADRGLLRCLLGDARRGLNDMQAGVTALDALLAADAPVNWGEDAPVGDVVQRIRSHVVENGNLHSDINTRRGSLALWLAWVGRYAEAVAIGEQYVVDTHNRSSISHQLADACGDALAGLGHAYAALGRPDDAFRYFGLARDTYRSIDHHFKEGNTAIYELFEASIPYSPDHIEQREWLAMAAEDG